jgi:hypothetical protein
MKLASETISRLCELNSIIQSTYYYMDEMCICRASGFPFSSAGTSMNDFNFGQRKGEDYDSAVNLFCFLVHSDHI